MSLSHGTSGRRLTPSTIADITLPSTFSSVMPVWVFDLAQVIQEYDDLLTGVTDEDEAVAEQSYMPDACEQFDFDFLSVFTEELDGPHTTMLEPVSEEDEQLVCSTPYPAEYAEILFDAVMPYASDEDLALRAVFAPEALPTPLLRPVEAEERSPTPELLDTSELKQQPTVAVHKFRDTVSEMLNFDLSPVVGRVQEITSSYIPRQGRSLMRPAPMFEEPTAHEPAQGKLKPVTTDNLPVLGPAGWQIEYDQVLRYVTGRSFLPDLDYLRNITARSAFVPYDNEINKLSHATSSFSDDRRDGECGCLDGKPEALRVPGENFLLADNNESFGLSVERPSAQSTFDIIDELVDEEMFQEADTADATPDIFDIIDELVDADMFDAYESDDDFAIEEMPRPGDFFDTTLRQMTTFIALGQLLYPPTVSHLNIDVNVSDMSDNEFNDSDSSQISELTYFAADGQQSVACTAYNPLLQWV
jgi:hypothetical protein